jgi:hypothetical protein
MTTIPSSAGSSVLTLALGATRRQILTTAMRAAVSVVAAGVLIGIIA